MAVPLTLLIAAVLPPVLTAFFAAAWWQVLPRPWLFVFATVFSLYLLLAVVVASAVFMGPGMGSYFLEAPSSSRVAEKHLPTAELLALVVFVVFGGAISWLLGRWQL